MPPRIDPLHSAAIGFDVAAAAWATPAALQARQRRRLQALLAHAAAHSRVYAGRLRDIDPATVSLADIKPVTKAHLMRHFDDWVTDARLSLAALRRFTTDRTRIGATCLDDYVVWTSSGTSGEPALFVQDARALAVYDALEALRRTWRWPTHGWSGGRFAFVGATDGHFASTVTLERLRRLAPGLATTLRGFSFLLPQSELCAQLTRFRPAVLATYPTYALMLAEEARAGRLAIAPQEIWTGGETLTAAMRRHIGESFGCAVSDSYGASEFLPIAAECRHGRLHVNEDWVILESVDHRRAPVPDGQAGATTLLTNLANHVQPLIRYDLGDRIALHREPCACGRPTAWLEVEGRNDDLLALHDAQQHVVRLSPLALTTVLEDDAEVFAFQLEQSGAAALSLRIAESEPADRAALARASAALRRYLYAQGLGNVVVAAACGAPLQPGAGGKVRRVKALRTDRPGPGPKTREPRGAARR